MERVNTKNVIVIGSGIAGTASAFRLWQSGYHVTLLGRRSNPRALRPPGA
ncbi:FAD-dependent oxidoreductase [Streptomyces amakusaensis]|uniref:FAD-dependent oxidoreductase n=1 Tax=Streptomyces amakusaensis TaxID=67271 RepID=A0ABW0AP08_9ACTN